jgi:hypothetical protein
MTEPDSLPTAENNPPTLRWYQWRLRSMFILMLLVAIGMSGYQVWRQSRTLPLPAAADIQGIDFGINLGFGPITWYELPLSAGKALADCFRDSVLMPSRQHNPNIHVDPLPHEYSLRIVDKKGRECCLQFRVYSNDVYLLNSCTGHSFYTFPDSRISHVRKLVQDLLSTNEVAGGRYSYIAGEDDHSHYSRICESISGENTPSQEVASPQR